MSFISYSELTQYISLISKINTLEFIPIVERILTMEEANLASNRNLGMEYLCIQNEITISNCKLLISVLRMHRASTS